MWYEILKFELQYRKKRPGTFIYFGIMFLVAFLAISTDAVQIGGGAGLVKENAPATIAFMMAIISAFFMMITSAIMGVGVLRDFEHQTESIMFVNPITKMDYLLGRFLGSFLVLLFVFTGALLGFILGEFMPWREADKLLSFQLWNYLQPFLFLVVPNLIFSGILFFIIGALSRKMVVVYASWILLFVLYQIAGAMTAELEDKDMAAILDPFALTAIQMTTQYWTVAEQNSLVIPMEGSMLINRILWVCIGIAVAVIGYFSFSFTVVRKSIFKKKLKASEEKANTQMAIPKVQFFHDFITSLAQIRTLSVFYFKQVFKSVPFIAMAGFGIITLIINSFYIGEVFGTFTYPTTYRMLELIGGFNLFFLIILVSYTGELIWKEREARINLIFDSIPMSDAIALISKFFGLILVFMTLMLVLIGTGVLIQTFNGYYKYELGIYFAELYTDVLFNLVLFSLLSFFIQVMVNNKFLGYALMVLFFITSAVLSNWGVEHTMFQFASGNLGTYSDMNGYGHFIPGFSWLNLYWFGLASLLFAISIVFAVRGSEAIMKTRWHVGKLRLTKPLLTFAIAGIAVFFLSGFYVYYNTNVLSTYRNSDEQNAQRADYEKALKQYEYLQQPLIDRVSMHVELYPYERDYQAEGSYYLVNAHQEPINQVHIQLNPEETHTYDYVRFDREATVDETYDEFRYYIYTLQEPLAPGDSMRFEFKSMYQTKGFGQSSSSTDVVFNGSFFSNSHFPAIGYQADYELGDDDDREDNDLEPKDRALPQDDPRGLARNMFSDDAIGGIDFDITIGTSADQIAIAPGYLQKEWEENGRRYYQYKMDKRIEPFFNIVSAKYSVMEDKMTIPLDSGSSKDISLEIYYHEGHEYNLESMMKSMKESFAYFSSNFSPYQYRQMRILEFPRYASFAQSFANTVPFSEGIGFVLKIEEEDDVDVAYYVTAHELAHQWWGHQIIGANVQGNTMLIESLAQYGALMVMKQAYPQEHMQDFLEQELDRYLSGRAGEQKKELPLYLVENQQYIHYGKGAVVMYALQDYIGEDKVNAALSKFITDWQDPKQAGRYPTSSDLITYFREVAPDSMQYLITDLFEKIVLFENKTEKAEYTSLADGTYTLNLTVDSKKFEADSLGNTKPVVFSEWIDIGVYTESSAGKDSLIYLQKHKVSDGENVFEIPLDAKPSKAGIDPLNILIDRNPDDNRKSATEVELNS